MHHLSAILSDHSSVFQTTAEIQWNVICAQACTGWRQSMACIHPRTVKCKCNIPRLAWAQPEKFASVNGPKGMLGTSDFQSLPLPFQAGLPVIHCTFIRALMSNHLEIIAVQIDLRNNRRAEHFQLDTSICKLMFWKVFHGLVFICSVLVASLCFMKWYSSAYFNPVESVSYSYAYFNAVENVPQM